MQRRGERERGVGAEGERALERRLRERAREKRVERKHLKWGSTVEGRESTECVCVCGGGGLEKEHGGGGRG